MTGAKYAAGADGPDGEESVGSGSDVGEESAGQDAFAGLDVAPAAVVGL